MSRVRWWLFFVLFSGLTVPLVAVYAPIPENEQEETLTVILDAGVRHDDNLFGAAADARDSVNLYGAWEGRWDASLSEQALLRLNYRGEANYFEERPGEQTLFNHLASARFDYTFSPALFVSLGEAVSIIESPASIEPLSDAVLAADQSAWDNTLDGRVDWLISDRWSIVGKGLIYGLNYEVDALAQLLDRVDYLMAAEVRRNVSEVSVLLAEVQRQEIRYDASDNLRGSETYNLLGGYERQFGEQGGIDVRLGVELRDRNGGDSQENIFASVGGLYNYTPGSFISGGLTFRTREASDIGTFFDEQVVSLVLNGQHDLTGNGLLFLSALLSVEAATLRGRSGVADADEVSVRAGLKLTYRLTERLSAVASVDLDEVDSDVMGRDQSRQRFGLSVRYTFGVE